MLRALRPEAAPIAGGTGLEVEMNARRPRPAAFLDPSNTTAGREPVPDVPGRQVLMGRPGRRQLTKARQ